MVYVLDYGSHVRCVHRESTAAIRRSYRSSWCTGGASVHIGRDN